MQHAEDEQSKEAKKVAKAEVKAAKKQAKAEQAAAQASDAAHEPAARQVAESHSPDERNTQLAERKVWLEGWRTVFAGLGAIIGLATLVLMLRGGCG